jgi:hypothetical protein
VHAPVGAIAPAVELQLKVGRVREPSAGLEVRAPEPVRSLKHTLGLRIAGIESARPDLAVVGTQVRLLLRSPMERSRDCRFDRPKKVKAFKRITVGKRFEQGKHPPLTGVFNITVRGTYNRTWPVATHPALHEHDGALTV